MVPVLVLILLALFWAPAALIQAAPPTADDNNGYLPGWWRDLGK
jgi:hypothetical protein